MSERGDIAFSVVVEKRGEGQSPRFFVCFSHHPLSLPPSLFPHTISGINPTRAAISASVAQSAPGAHAPDV